MRKVADYFQQVADQVQQGQIPLDLLDEGLRHGLNPWDLLIGIVQPALRTMGAAWAWAGAPTEAEHQFTANCSRLIDLLRDRQPGFEALSQAVRPEVLLVNAEGNGHLLGLRLVEFFLLTRATTTATIPSGVPTAEVLAAIRGLRPRKVGISCATAEQLGPAGRTVAAIAALPASIRPQVYVGGYAIRGHEAALRGWPCRITSDPADLLDPRLDQGVAQAHLLAASHSGLHADGAAHRQGAMA